MPEFILDTSGAVAEPDWKRAPALTVGRPLTWRDHDGVTQGFIEALFFTWPEGEGDYVGGITSPGYSDLAPFALAKIITDCIKFQASPEWKAFERWREDESDGDAADDEQAGRDFLFSRNGHGVGFWDRPTEFYGPHQTPLDNLARTFGNLDAYIGDDEKAHVEGEGQ